MYSLEDRMKAIQRFLKYDRNTAAVIRELGYPSRRALREWVREYETAGALHNRQSRRRKYSEEQIQAAVKHYLEHGRHLQGSIRALGYPSKGTIRQWLDKAVPDRQQGLHSKRKLQPKIELTSEQKQAAVVDLSLRDGPAKKVAEKYGVSRAILYKWKNGLLGKEHPVSRQKRGKPEIGDDKDALLAKVATLKEQVETLEMLKKGQGADPKKLTNREKATAISALRTTYPLNDQSSYFYHRAALSLPDKYAGRRERVRAAFKEASGRYGYRRLCFCRAILSRGSRAIKSADCRNACQMKDGVRVFPPGSTPTPELRYGSSFSTT